MLITGGEFGGSIGGLIGLASICDEYWCKSCEK